MFQQPRQERRDRRHRHGEQQALGDADPQQPAHRGAAGTEQTVGLPAVFGEQTGGEDEGGQRQQSELDDRQQVQAAADAQVAVDALGLRGELVQDGGVDVGVDAGRGVRQVAVEGGEAVLKVAAAPVWMVLKSGVAITVSADLQQAGRR